MKPFKKKAPSLSDGYLKLSGLLLFCGILITGVVMVCSAVATYSDMIKTTLLQNTEALSANISDIYAHEHDTSDPELRQLIRREDLSIADETIKDLKFANKNGLNEDYVKERRKAGATYEAIEKEQPEQPTFKVVEAKFKDEDDDSTLDYLLGRGRK